MRACLWSGKKQKRNKMSPLRCQTTYSPSGRLGARIYSASIFYKPSQSSHGQCCPKASGRHESKSPKKHPLNLGLKVFLGTLDSQQEHGLKIRDRGENHKTHKRQYTIRSNNHPNNRKQNHTHEDFGTTKYRNKREYLQWDQIQRNYQN